MSPRGSGRGERRAVTGRHDGWWHYYDNFALHSGVEKVDASFTRLHASFINAPFRDSIFDWGNVSQFTGAPRAFRPAAMSEADGVPDVTDPSDMSEEAAAVKIQAMQRGKQARREHEELKRVQTAFVAFDTDGSGSLEIAELYDVLREVGVDIDKDTFADYQLALMEDYDADNSGTLDFREFRKFYDQVLANESTRKAYARELDAAVKGLVSSALTNVIERQEMEGAALKIQAVHRGKQARKELQEQREMESAAVKIQAVHRGKKARALYEQEKAELNSAALKIQAVHRGKQARSQIAKAKWSEEESRKARLAFWKFDEDQSGQLEVPELRGVLSSLGLTIPEQDFATYAAEIMAEFDTDGNGTLDYKEFEQFWLKCLASEELKAQYAAKVERACGKVVAGALANLYAKETEELAEQEELSAAAVKIQAVQRGKQARKEQEELFKVHAAFKKFDADKSGSLEIPELYDVLTEIGVELPREHFDEYVDALMDDYDTDNSGTLDFREFRKFYDQVLANENTKAEYAKELESAVSGLVSGAIANLYKREEEEEMSAAALKIQAVHRGKQARKQLQEQKEMESAALKIQAVHRGKQTRQSVDKTRRVKAAFDMFDADGSGELEIDELREVMTHLGLELSKGEFDHYAAALMEDYDTDNSGSLDFWEFEKFYEQCLASDDLRAAYANELDAAVKGVVSGALSNILEQHEMENAALKIQAVHRGKQARKELQEQREMEAAAVKIQAVHRGKMTRKNLVKPPPRASEAPPTPEPVAMSEEEELSAAAVKIQAVQRGKKARKEQEELFKVHAAFKKFDTDKSGSLEIPELYDVLQEIGVNLDQDTFDEYVEALMDDYDEDNSGTLDFREFRKFYDQVLANESTKAAYANELESAVSGLVSGAITNLFDRAEREEQENAALKIQAMHRGKKAREQLRKDRDEEEAAALKIQAMHRGRKTRQTLSRQKEAEAEEEELTAAALKIQAVHRGRKTRMELLKQKQEEEEELTAAALKIQAVHRGRKTRMDLVKERQEKEELEAAALKIQAVHRGRKTRMELLKEKQEQEELEAAALKIQAVHRGRKTRMDILREKQEKEELEAAALKIQAVHRGRKTRMDLLKEKQEGRNKRRWRLPRSRSRLSTGARRPGWTSSRKNRRGRNKRRWRLPRSRSRLSTGARRPGWTSSRKNRRGRNKRRWRLPRSRSRLSTGARRPGWTSSRKNKRGRSSRLRRSRSRLCTGAVPRERTSSCRCPWRCAWRRRRQSPRWGCSERRRRSPTRSRLPRTRAGCDPRRTPRQV